MDLAAEVVIVESHGYPACLFAGPLEYCIELCFFFSSRRRHTRCLSDWSSDVCSSDLTIFRRTSFTRNIVRFWIATAMVMPVGGDAEHPAGLLTKRFCSPRLFGCSSGSDRKSVV